MPNIMAIISIVILCQHDYIFFVAGCDGSTAFTVTYAEHQQRVADWRACEFRRFMPNPPKLRPTDDIPAHQALTDSTVSQ